MLFVWHKTYITLRPDSYIYKHLYISSWQHTRAYSSSPSLRPAHQSAQTNKTPRRCMSRPEYHPTLSDGQLLLRPLLHCPAPAAPSSTPDFCCFLACQSRALLCIRHFCLFVFHKRIITILFNNVIIILIFFTQLYFFTTPRIMFSSLIST